MHFMQEKHNLLLHPRLTFVYHIRIPYVLTAIQWIAGYLVYIYKYSVFTSY